MVKKPKIPPPEDIDDAERPSTSHNVADTRSHPASSLQNQQQHFPLIFVTSPQRKLPRAMLSSRALPQLAPPRFASVKPPSSSKRSEDAALEIPATLTATRTGMDHGNEHDSKSDTHARGLPRTSATMRTTAIHIAASSTGDLISLPSVSKSAEPEIGLDSYAICLSPWMGHVKPRSPQKAAIARRRQRLKQRIDDGMRASESRGSYSGSQSASRSQTPMNDGSTTGLLYPSAGDAHTRTNDLAIVAHTPAHSHRKSEGRRDSETLPLGAPMTAVFVLPRFPQHYNRAHSAAGIRASRLSTAAPPPRKPNAPQDPLLPPLGPSQSSEELQRPHTRMHDGQRWLVENMRGASSDSFDGSSSSLPEIGRDALIATTSITPLPAQRMKNRSSGDRRPGPVLGMTPVVVAVQKEPDDAGLVAGTGVETRKPPNRRRRRRKGSGRSSAGARRVTMPPIAPPSQRTGPARPSPQASSPSPQHGPPLVSYSKSTPAQTRNMTSQSHKPSANPLSTSVPSLPSLSSVSSTSLVAPEVYPQSEAHGQVPPPPALYLTTLYTRIRPHTQHKEQSHQQACSSKRQAQTKAKALERLIGLQYAHGGEVVEETAESRFEARQIRSGSRGHSGYEPHNPTTSGNDKVGRGLAKLLKTKPLTGQHNLPHTLGVDPGTEVVVEAGGSLDETDFATTDIG
ncbi:uncharacterized protein EV422DRAFT_564296 [Fimicolochytrium jonesii]|uniref:uncharacterized protein n=1 Tax=Fimicolochytrium jonesii TaxID=1396493 RepID=UPI0022FECB27|nr:uncharacterized protein EV422DRAFT_564296 [Fimicolochytrium jonesii]KAI8824936.1 hypothetical protein EV422DRAFT_564296 [Fimicolochytrium jonesii]